MMFNLSALGSPLSRSTSASNAHEALSVEGSAGLARRSGGEGAPKVCAGAAGAGRLRKWAGALMLAAGLLGLARPAQVQAQTAHTGGVVTTTITGSAYPYGIAVDPSNNVYVADANNGVVYKFTYNSGSYVQSTLFTGIAGVYGVALDTAGNIYLANDSAGAGSVIKETYNSTTNTYTASTLESTQTALGIAVDATGNVYFSQGPHVYKIPYNGTSYTAMVLITNDLSYADTIAVDAAGSLYIGSYGSGIVKETYNSTTNTFTESTLPVPTVQNPEGVALDRKGNLYINDAANGVVYEATPSGNTYILTTLAPAASTGGGGVAVGTNGLVYATAQGIFRRVGTQSVFPSTPVGTASTQVPINFSIDTTGTLGTTKALTFGVTGQDFSLGTGSTCTGAATGPCVVNLVFTPKFPGLRQGAVELTNSGGTAIATAPVNGLGTGPEVTQTPGTISTVASNALTTGLTLQNNQDIIVDPSGTIYIASGTNNTVYKVVGTTATAYGTGFSTPVALALDGAGNLYVGEATAGDVKVVNAATGVTSVVTGATGLGTINGVAVDSAGNLYVAGVGNNRVYQVSPTGVLSTIAGTGTAGFSGDGAAATLAQVNQPLGLGIDSLNNIYINDSGNNRVRKITATSGYISTIAGNGTAGFSGDGGLGTSAMVNAPRGQIMVDAGGDVYFSDIGNARIRVITAASGIISTIVGTGTAGNTGDGGSAITAKINGVTGLALTGNGTLYLDDTNSQVVRQVTPTAYPLAFASPVGVTQNQTATVNNIGNTALTFPNTGAANPLTMAPFALNGGTCPQLGAGSTAQTLAAGTSCTDIIGFTPQTNSTFSNFTLTTTDNSLNVMNATQTVLLNGTSSAGPSTITVTNLSATAGSAVTLTATIAYGGVQPTGAVTFQVGATTLVGAVTCTAASFTETCTTSYVVPAATATTALTITATLAADANYATMTGTGTLTDVPTSFLAPTGPVGTTSATQTATLVFTTAGTTNATLGTAIRVVTQGATGLDFAYVSGGTCAISTAYAVGQTCTVQYTFTPKTPGARIGAIQIYDGSATPVLIAKTLLNGLGTGPLAAFTGNAPVATAVTGTGSAIAGVSVDSAGNIYYTFNLAAGRVYKYSPATGTTTVYPGSGPTYGPVATAVDGAGNLYFISSAGTGTTAVQIVAAGQTAVTSTPTFAQTGQYQGNQIAVDGLGNIYVPRPAGVVKLTYPAYTETDLATSLVNVGGVALDSANNIYAVTLGGTLSQITQAGVVTTLATTGMNQPVGIQVDAAGNIYVANAGSNTIVRYAAGTYAQTTVASGFTPRSLAFDIAGNLYASDLTNGRITVIPMTTVPASTFANTAVGATSADSPKTTVLENNGNATLTVTGLGVTSASVGSFKLGTVTASSGSTAGSVLAAGTVTIPVNFTPQTVGTPLTGTLTVTDNTLNVAGTVQMGALSGTSTLGTPVVTVTNSAGLLGSPATLTATITYGGVQPAGAVTFTVGGGAAVTATCTAGTGSETCTAAYPTTGFALGANTITATIAAGPNYSTASNTGTLTLLSNSFTAPTEPVGTTSPTQTATLFFNAATTLNATAATAIQVVTQGLTGYDFAYVSGSTATTACAPGTAYAAGSSCTVTYSFTPKAPGLRQGAIELFNNAGTPVLAVTVYLSGTGQGPLADASPGLISTLAGTGAACTGTTACGDGAAATAATLNNPQNIAVDVAGNKFFTDTGSQRVRKIAAGTGIITTVAGSGALSPNCNSANGSGGPATAATFYYPQALAIDGAGNLYIADTGDSSVSKVSATTGTLTIIAGGIAGSGNSCQHDTGDGGPATSASVNSPDGLLVDGAGNLYIADNGNYVRKISGATGIISTVVGTGVASATGDGGPGTSATVNGPAQMAMDTAGNLYIADYGNNRIRKLTPGGTISTVAGNGTAGSTGDGGLATAATLQAPNSVAVDAAGNLYIANEGNSVRMVTASTGIISTVVGTGTAGSTGDGGSATSALLNTPEGLTIDGAGNIYIADTNNNKIRLVSAANTTTPLNFANTQVGVASTDSPKFITINNTGNTSLTLSAIAFPADFVNATGSTCTATTTLLPATSCLIAVSFKPVSAGPKSETLTVTDNSGGGFTQTYTLNGTATVGTPVVTVTTSPTIVYGTASVSLSATVAYGGATPTGAVTFTIGTGAAVTATCTGATTPRTCTATYPTTAFGSNVTNNATYTITATEAADTNYAVASNTGTLTVTRATPVVSNVSSPTIVNGTATTTLSATLTYTGALAPASAFTFTIGTGAAVGATCTGAASPLTCTATYPTSTFGAGTYTITANQAAGPNYNAASNTGTLTVASATPVVTVTSLNAPAGSTPTLTATIAYGGTVAPQGAVTFTVGTNAAVTATCTANAGTETCTAAYPTTGLTAGPNTITATLAADANYNTASGTGTLTIIPTSFTAVTEPVGTTSPTQTATLLFTTSGTLGSDNVLTLGATGLDYNFATGGTCVVGTAYTAGQTCTVNYTFTPRTPGQRPGAIVFKDNSATPVVLGMVYLGGLGTGPQGLFTTGTSANVARNLNIVRGVSLDGAGNIYASEQGSNLIERFDPVTGAKTLLASDGSGVSGTTVDGAGNVFYGTGNGVAELVGGAGTPVMVVSGYNPDNILLTDGAGNIYFSANGGIYRISPGTGVATPLAAVGSNYRFIGLAIDAAGNIFAPDFYSSTMFELVAGSSTLTTLFSGNGLANPHGIAVDAAGNLYVTNNSGNGDVQRYAAGTYAHTDLSTGSASVGITIDAAGNLLVLDNGDITRYTRTTAATLNLANTAVGATSAAQSTGFENDGNTALTIASIATTTSFTVDAASTTCSTTGTLAAAGTCAVGAKFTPTSAGAKTGFINITDNTLNATGTVQQVPLTATATQATPTVAVSNVSVAYGAATANLSATLTYVSGVPPTGAFTFTVGSLAAVTATCTQNVGSTTVKTCTASVGVTTLQVGTYTITGSQAADTNYIAASNTGTLTVTQGTPVVTVASSSASLSATTTTLSATVAFSGALAPTGAVTFQVGATGPVVTGTCTGTTTPRSCTATYPLNTVAVGANTITVTEAASTNYFAASNTGTLTGTIGTGTVAVSNVSTVYGTANTTLSATVTYTGTTAPTGAFTFTVGTGAAVTATCTGTTSPVSCTASYPTATLAGGTYTITGSLAADARFSAASNTGTLTVTKATPTVIVSAATTTYGAATTTLTAMVTYAGSGTFPTGAFTFTVDSGAAVTATCSGAGSPRTCTATYNTATLTAGSHQITGTQAADGNYNAASNTTPNTLLTVGKTTPVISVAPASTSYTSTPTTLSATIAYSGALVPTGAVMFSVDSGTALTATCNASASPETCTVSYPTGTLLAGAHTITVTLAADSNYNASSSTGTLTIVSTPPTITFTVTNHTYGDAPFTVTATSNSTGAFTYTVVSGNATVSGNTVTITGIGSVTLQATEAADANYTAGSKQATFTIAQAQLTITANNSTRVYGAPNPTFTGTVTGQQYNDTFTESFSTTAVTTSAPGGYPIVPAVTGTNLVDYMVTAVNGTLTITKAPVTVTLSSSGSPVNPNQTVTFNVTVASTTTGLPSGQVTFTDTTTGLVIGTATLVNGAASISTTTLSPATQHVVTATYSGDTNFLAGTSNFVSVGVNPLDFTFTTTSAPALTVAPGTVATYTFQVAPLFVNYAGPVTFTVTGLPTGATATFTPSTVAANGGSQTITMNVQTPKPMASNGPHGKPDPFGRSLPVLALLLLPAFASRKLRRKLGTRLLAVVVFCAGLAGAAALTGCGSGTNGFLLEQPSTYTLTVTATAGSLQHSQTVTLTVQ